MTLYNSKKENKTIAFICFSASYGGLELSVLRLASGFRKRNIRSIIILPPNTPLLKFAEEQNFATICIKPKIKYVDIVTSYKLAKVFEKENLEAAIIMQSKDLHLAALANKLYSKTRLYFYQEMQSKIDKKDFIHTWVYSKLSKWITLTNKMREDALIYTRIPEEKIEAVPIGTDLIKFDPKLYNGNDERIKFRIPIDKLIIGALGRLDPLKGQEELIRAIPQIIKSQPNTYFVFVGDATPDRKDFQKYLIELCEKLEINNYVQFIPFTDKTPQILSTFDIFVLPSHCETFGFVVVEAMAMGKPVIGTNAGGVPEIIQHDVNGLLIPPKDSKALAETIVSLLQSPETRIRLSQQAYEDIRKRFDFNKTIERLEQIILK